MKQRLYFLLNKLKCRLKKYESDGKYYEVKKLEEIIDELEDILNY